MSTVIGSVELGLVFAILSLGLFIAFRILNLPDLTVDGSFVTGLAYSAVWSQVDRPYTGIIMACIGGAVAGLITGIFHTKLKIHEILAGILTMTGLYSVNLMIMGDKPSVFFYGKKTIFTGFERKYIFNGTDMGKLFLLLIIVAVLLILMYLFFKTQIGLSLRATGDNEFMVRSSSINTDLMKILGFVLCNAIVALSGAVYAQYSSTATNGMGVGMLVLGLASIIIGETVVGKRGMLRHLIAVVVGAIIYRFMLTFAFAIGLPPVNLKLFSAVIVVIAISLPIIKPTYKKWRKIYAGN
jgi:hypothetical protein